VLEVFVSSQEATSAQGLKVCYKMEYLFSLFQWAKTIIHTPLPSTSCSNFQW